MSALEELKTVLAEVTDLHRVGGVLEWDQETYMPAGGVAARAREVALISRLAHERFVSDQVRSLLERAEAQTQSLAEDSDDRSLVRVARRDFDEATKLPAALVEAMARAQAESQPVWVEARRRSDWALYQPRMERTAELARRVADAYGYRERPMDALIAQQEPGLTLADVDRIFAELRNVIVPLVREIGGRPLAPDLLDRTLEPPDRQISFGLDVARALGYSTERGRIDLSAHPFTIGLGRGDVRITARVEHGLNSVYGTIHEAGHAMYEQGVASEIDQGPLAGGTTPGVHESQSRLWENQVGRSRAFAGWILPRLQQAFGDLDGLDPDGYYRSVNLVRPSYIRVDADEVTYNLHIMLRTELEGELLEGRLRVADIPEAWNQKLSDYLGLAPPPSTAEGCLQDIHWTFPVLGSFVGYTLGNVIGPQLLATAVRSIGDLDELIARGDFATLLGWLQENVYRHGRKFTPNELLTRVTGEPINPAYWTQYIRDKYTALYDL